LITGSQKDKVHIICKFPLTIFNVEYICISWLALLVPYFVPLNHQITSEIYQIRSWNHPLLLPYTYHLGLKFYRFLTMITRIRDTFIRGHIQANSMRPRIPDFWNWLRKSFSSKGYYLEISS
jgi:hypothetical protein